MPNAESGGESLARPTRRSIDTSSVMGLYVDDDEAEVGGDADGGVENSAGVDAGVVAGSTGLGELLDEAVGGGSCGFFAVVRFFADDGMVARSVESKNSWGCAVRKRGGYDTQTWVGLEVTGTRNLELPCNSG